MNCSRVGQDAPRAFYPAISAKMVTTAEMTALDGRAGEYPMSQIEILFVDDDPALRSTLPAILNGHGYHVITAATVPEALAEIGSHHFRVLISDLNIGHPGDGFAVVSAMRRTQPECINFILTGYPAFEAALNALRSHVDDYLVKPSNINELVAEMEAKLALPERHGPLPLRQVASVISENVGPIAKKVLQRMKDDPRIKSLPISDQDRINHLPELLHSLASQLESQHPPTSEPQMVKAAALHGRLRHQQGYSIPMIVEDIRFIDEAIYESIQDHVISLDLSNLLPDLRKLNQLLEIQLRESLIGYLACDQERSRKAS